MAEVTKEDLINELIHLQTVSEELYDYHPDNPDRTDVAGSYASIQLQIRELEDKIESLG
tara:strand:- start:274 stop:450 length:177 start_codon:yes stop_codon:yes gene_type:complete